MTVAAAEVMMLARFGGGAWVGGARLRRGGGLMGVAGPLQSESEEEEEESGESREEVEEEPLVLPTEKRKDSEQNAVNASSEVQSNVSYASSLYIHLRSFSSTT